jgi:hypothetical protein
MVNASIVGVATELVAFKLISPDALRVVARIGADPSRVAALPPGQFVSYNRLSGGIQEGQVFG